MNLNLITYYLIALTLFSSNSLAKTASIVGIDLRDHVRYETAFKLPAQILVRLIQSNPCVFLSEQQLSVDSPNLRHCTRKLSYPNSGAVGPDGYEKSGRFVVTKENSETRENTILAVEFDGPNSLVQISNREWQADLILFVHDSQKYENSDHYYFRRVQALFNTEGKIQFIPSATKEFPITETKFSFFVDVTERKAIMHDSILNITKVVPIAVGAFDFRTLPGMDNFAGTLSEEFKNNAQLSLSQPAGLYLERSNPAMYKARPFLGIADKGGTEYRGIAFHYKMADGDFSRGFVTHGCFRTDDKDLYQMSALVFSSAAGHIPVKVVNSFATEPELHKFLAIDHPMPKENKVFFHVGYLDESYFSKQQQDLVARNIQRWPRTTYLSEIERLKWCLAHDEVSEGRQKGVPQLRRFGRWSSALDEYCLTKIVRQDGNVSSLIAEIHRGAPSNSDLLQPEVQPLLPKIMPGLCDGDLSTAQRYYREKSKHSLNSKDRTLSYRIYVSNCGCQKFSDVLRNAILRNKEGKLMNKSDRQELFKGYCG